MFNIQKVIEYLERKGKSRFTITNATKGLKRLAKLAPLKDTIKVELAISRLKKKNGQNASNAYKQKLCQIYKYYCNFYEIKWEKPTYTPDESSIQPPTAEQMQMLLASARGILSLRIQISIETGLRPIEVTGEKGLKAKDIHPEHKNITARNTKKCNARPPIKISDELIARLQTHIAKNNLTPEDTLFKGKPETYGNHFRYLKKQLAKRLNQPEIKNIRLYDLRHAYVTKKLFLLQNAEKVRQLMGHKQLNTTQKYFHLLNFDTGEFEVEYAQNKDEAKKLMLAHFKYECTTPDGYMMFKKPK